MKRSDYVNYIEDRLNCLAERVNTRSKLALLDFNIHCETFYAKLFNIIFNYDLENLNKYQKNSEFIDLIDKKNKIIIQVSSTARKEKIQNSFPEFDKYYGYHFKFICIKSDVSNLKKLDFKTPSNIIFNPKLDIFDVVTILDEIINLDIDKMIKVYEFIKKELGYSTDNIKIESNLSKIINLIAEEDLSNIEQKIALCPYQISKKIEQNKLEDVKYIIDDYKIYYCMLDKKYNEFDKLGKNKSLSVFNKIRDEFNNLPKTLSEAQKLYAIAEVLIKYIENCTNYIKMPFEELEMCVKIIIVDAFIRCKIYNNPEGYYYVVTR
jgi:hypothetical protein